MGKNSLENFCSKLFKNLLEELIFYIPDNEIFNVTIKAHNLLELKIYFQKVIYMDKMKGPLMYTNDTYKPNMLEKASLLNRNILSLIDKKGKLDLVGFNYVFDKYYEQVQGIYFVATWLNNNERLAMVEQANVRAINKFKSQEQLYEKHLLELNATFKNSKELVSQNNDRIIKNLELQFPVLFKQLKGIDTALEENKNVIDQLVKEFLKYQKTSLNNVAIPKSNKKILITETEAKEFLLETVFGIKLQ